MRGQLSIDYIIVFSFVLIVFILIFGLVANQRVNTSQSQEYAQLQAIAQAIAQDINLASNAGNGYAQNVSLPAGAGLINYNLSVTSSGTVVVYINSSGRLAYAYAFSPVSRIISSPLYINPNAPQTYRMPTASGMLFLQNSFGSVCIDYVCNSTAQLASGLNVYTGLTHAATMNGQDSYIYVPNSVSLLAPFNTGAITMSAWVYVSRFPLTANVPPIVAYGTVGASSYCFGPRIYVSANGIGTGFQDLDTGEASAILPAYNDTWYFVAWTYSPVSKTITMYLNNEQTTSKAPVSLDPPGLIYNLMLGSDKYTYNSGAGACGSGSNSAPWYFNGSVSNVQIYSSALTANQIYQIQSSGISGAPVNSPSLVAWYPLNGNANDSSGNGNNGAASSVVYPAVAQINARVTNTTGVPLKNELVGFATTLGKFSGDGSSTFNLTNSDGVATTYVMQTNSTGFSTLKVTPFEGNLSTEENLSGWWPLNTNQGNVTYNIINNTANINTASSSWNNANYAGLFNGQDSYVDVPNSLSTEIYGIPLSLSFWVSPSQAQQLESVAFKPQEFEACVGNGYLTFGDNHGSDIVTNYNLSDNRWYNIVFTLDGNYLASTYVNGQLVDGPRITGSWAASANTLDMVIGGNQSSAGTSCANSIPYDGQLADMQLYRGTLSAQQALQLYSEGIGGSPISGMLVSGWWPLNSNTNDYSGNRNNGAAYGAFAFAAPTNIQNANINNLLATEFNGQDSYIIVNTINNYDRINYKDSFTLTAWVYYKGGTNFQGIAGDYQPGGTGFQLSGHTYGSSGPLIVANTIVPWPTGISNFPKNTWEMVTAVYNGTTGVAQIYLNNNPFATNNLGPNLNLAEALPFYIGNTAWQPNGAGSFNGFISDVQLYSGTLSGQDINILYNSGFYGFPLPSSGLVAWWPLNGNANDSSGNGNNGKYSNTIYTYQINPAVVPEHSGYGLSFPGQTAGVYAPYYKTIGSNSKFSIASWVYLTAPMQDQGVYLGTYNGLYKGYALFRTTNTMGFETGTGTSTAGAISYNDTPFPLGKWTYVVGTYDGYNLSYYVDGRLLAKNTLASTPAWTGQDLFLGGEQWANYHMQGSLANVEYYNTSLTLGQVYQLYNNQLPLVYSERVPLSWGA